jgi:hypothetical protein
MSEKTPHLIKRAVQAAAFTVGGGVALSFAMAGSAHADEITVQDSNVTNAGASFANSGGNVAVGNASTNVAACAQGALGLVASNSCQSGNTSNGTANITTGAATATGNQSETTTAQANDAGDDPGLVVGVQDSDVTNVGVSAANTGGNVAVGNASTNVAVNAQGAAGLVASNHGSASNASNGTADITTGAATATGNLSKTTTDQAVTGGDGAGLAIIVQDTDVLNLGVAVANTGGNLAVGNASTNLAANLQGALGLVASNDGSATNASNGSATVKTGAASATGNSSSTDVGQGIDIDPTTLSLVFQSAPVVNAGIGIANTGLNGALANGSTNADLLAQISFGLLATNTGAANNLSDGFATVLSGAANGVGNLSTTHIDQDS